MSELAFFEKCLIQGNITKLNYQDIAGILDKPVEAVQKYAEEYLKGKTIIPFHNIEIKKKEKKALAKANIIQCKKKTVIRSAPKKIEPKLQTKSVDYSKMERVIIDKKTSIMVQPGTNHNAAREAYKKKTEKVKEASTSNPQSKKQKNAKRDKHYPEYYRE